MTDRENERMKEKKKSFLSFSYLFPLSLVRLLLSWNNRSLSFKSFFLSCLVVPSSQHFLLHQRHLAIAITTSFFFGLLVALIGRLGWPFIDRSLTTR